MSKFNFQRILKPIPGWLIMLLLLTSCYPLRIVFWNFAGQQDQDRFPKRVIDPSKDPFYFKKAEASFPLYVDQFVDHKLVNRSLNEVLTERKSCLAMLVIRSDTIIYDYYADDLSDSSSLTVFSISKSFINLLAGIAITENKIKLGDPITSFIPELQEKHGFEKITIEHLLAHTTGIHFNENYLNPFTSDVAKFYYGKSLQKRIDRLKVEELPGQSFQYQSANTQLLALVIQKAMGESIAELMERYIWTQIGTSHAALWNTYEKEDIEKAFCCLSATPLDFAKFGRLVMNYGLWEGDQVVDSTWISRSTEFSNQKGSVWGYQWHWQTGRKEYGDFMTQGLYDQFIYVMPKKEVVIVLINDFHRPHTYWPELFRQMVDQL